MKALVCILVAVAASCTGCGCTMYAQPDQQVETFPDGRVVTCLQAGDGGLSCDWGR